MTRRFQFSLRALLVGVVMVALFLGGFLGGVRFGERREQERRRLTDEREAQELQELAEAAEKNRSGGWTTIWVSPDNRHTTQHAQSLEMSGFEGLSPRPVK